MTLFLDVHLFSCNLEFRKVTFKHLAYATQQFTVPNTSRSSESTPPTPIQANKLSFQGAISHCHGIPVDPAKRSSIEMSSAQMTQTIICMQNSAESCKKIRNSLTARYLLSNDLSYSRFRSLQFLLSSEGCAYVEFWKVIVGSFNSEHLSSQSHNNLQNVMSAHSVRTESCFDIAVAHLQKEW